MRGWKLLKDKMLKYLLLFCCITTASLAKAQTEKELVGLWKVAEVTMDKSSPYADNPMFIKLKTAMLASQFDFRADHRFILKGDPKNTQPMPEAVWHYDKEKKLIDVDEAAKTSNKLLYFMVSKDAQGNMLFKSVDIPFILKVHK